MTSEPGWHPDPVPPTPGAAPQLRYWDGTRWTEHVAPAQAEPTASPEAQPPGPSGPSGSQPGAYGGTYGAPAGGQPTPYPAYQSNPANAAYGSPGFPTTPDGVPLAGWWQRVLALVLDGILLGIVGALIAIPWWREVIDSYRDWFDTAIDSANTGASVDTTQLQSDIARPLAIIAAINLGLGLVYNVAFLMWKQATPGKLLLGLRVRLRERPGPMPLGTVLLRWVGQYGPGVLALIPFVGAIFGLYSILDDLWPLWDSKKQAIHDKVAKTNVVRTR